MIAKDDHVWTVSGRNDTRTSATVGLKTFSNENAIQLTYTDDVFSSKNCYWTANIILHSQGSEEYINQLSGLDHHQVLDLASSDKEQIKLLQRHADKIQKNVGSDNANNSRYIALKLIFPAKSGQLLRSDIFERRLECCRHLKTVKSFTRPLQNVVQQQRPDDSSLQTGLLDHLSQALCVLEIKYEDEKSYNDHIEELDAEISNRLSFDWILPIPASRRRIAWVQGRENYDSIRRAYEAAAALGITLVILDEPGHWLEDDKGPYAYLREAFVPISIDFDEQLCQRVVHAVRAYPLPIDGVVTISDVRLHAIAKACEVLGLPTSPAAAHAIAENKFRTRQLEPDAKDTYLLGDEHAVDEFLGSQQARNLQYPLIVKPCRGWNSDCVTKVNDRSELIVAVQKASQRHRDATNPSTSVLIEPYIDGPEVDINLVLLDGEVIFFEVNDDFPSTADSTTTSTTDLAPAFVSTTTNSKANFQETQQVIPSALPASEIVLLRDSLRHSILRQGFTSGVFHCEARVRNSTMRYQSTPHDTHLVDLHPIITIDEDNTNNYHQTRRNPPPPSPTLYLHEINARPPGYIVSVAVLLAWGIDYYALRLLFALNPVEEEHRIRALSTPFIGGPQFFLSATMIPQTRTGIMKTVDAATTFLKNHPEVRENVVDYRTHQPCGSILEGPEASSLWWVAHLSIVSRRSRNEVLKLADYVQRNFDYDVVETEGRGSSV